MPTIKCEMGLVQVMLQISCTMHKSILIPDTQRFWKMRRSSTGYAWQFDGSLRGHLKKNTRSIFQLKIPSTAPSVIQSLFSNTWISGSSKFTRNKLLRLLFHTIMIFILKDFSILMQNNCQTTRKICYTHWKDGQVQKKY